MWIFVNMLDLHSWNEYYTSLVLSFAYFIELNDFSDADYLQFDIDGETHIRHWFRERLCVLFSTVVNLKKKITDKLYQ